MQAIILCGGLATRLGEAAKTVPKVLLEIAGKTVLEWQIRLLREAGVTTVVLASGHLHDVLYEQVGDELRWHPYPLCQRRETTRDGWRNSERNETDRCFPFFCAERRYPTCGLFAPRDVRSLSSKHGGSASECACTRHPSLR